MSAEFQNVRVSRDTVARVADLLARNAGAVDPFDGDEYSWKTMLHEAGGSLPKAEVSRERFLPEVLAMLDSPKPSRSV